MSEKRNTIPPNSATVLNEPLNETAVQVVDPAPDPEAPTNVDEPIAGDIQESALPTASSASSIAHLRALNTSGESVNIAPNSIADLALRTANKTKVQTLAGMDYSLLTEQIVHGEYWMDMSGAKKQVYTRTFKGTMSSTIGSGAVLNLPGVTRICSFDGYVLEGGYPIGVNLWPPFTQADNALWEYYLRVDLERLYLIPRGSRPLGGLYIVTIKYTKA